MCHLVLLSFVWCARENASENVARTLSVLLLLHEDCEEDFRSQQDKKTKGEQTRNLSNVSFFDKFNLLPNRQSTHNRYIALIVISVTCKWMEKFYSMNLPTWFASEINRNQYLNSSFHRIYLVAPLCRCRQITRPNRKCK